MSNFLTRFFSGLASQQRAFVPGPMVVTVSDAAWGVDPSEFSPTEYGWYIATSTYVYVCAEMRAKALASLPLRLYRGEGDQRTEVESGAARDLLGRVNPYWTWPRLIHQTEQSLCLWGAAYWLLERGNAARRPPAEIWWARPDTIRVLPDEVDYLKGFVHHGESGGSRTYAPDEVIWLRYPNPVNEFAGLSPLAAARLPADVASAAMQANRAMFANGSQPAGFFYPKSGQSWSKQYIEEFMETLRRDFGGVGKRHRIGALSEEAGWLTMAMTNKDAEFVEGVKLARDQVALVYGIPLDLIGGQATYANASEAHRMFWELTIKPEARFLAAEITERLLPMFEKGADAPTVAEFDFGDVEALKEDETARWVRAQQQAKDGFITINEWRKDEGKASLPWGDVWWKPVNLEPIDSAEPPEPIAPPTSAAPLAAGAEDSDDQEDSDDAQPRRRRRAVDYGSPEHDRLWRAFVVKTEPWERKVGDMTADLLRRQRQAVLTRLTRSLKRRGVDDVADNPFNLPRWIKAFRVAMRPLLDELVAEIGAASLDDLGVGIAFDVLDPNVVRFIEGRAQRFAREVNQTTWDQLKRSLADGIEAGEGIDALADRVRTVMNGRIASSGEVIARTEVIGASNGAMQASWVQSGVVSGKRWLSALDSRTRETHAAAHGQEVALDADFRVGAATGPGPGLMSSAEETIQCRCFPGDTPVRADGLVAASMRWYEGDVTRLTLADGRILTATPNHPMLTTSGWVAAGKLDVGDDLVCGSFDQDAVLADPNPDDAPATIAEVFRLAAALGARHRVAGVVPDFHGDGGDRQIDVVRPLRRLGVGNVTAIGEPPANDVLSPTDRAQRSLSPGDARSARIGRQALALDGVGLAHAGNHRRSATARLDAGFDQPTADAGPANTERVGDSLLRLAGLVSRDDRLVIDGDATLHVDATAQRFSGSAHRDTGRAEPGADDLRAYAERGGDHGRRLASLVATNDFGDIDGDPAPRLRLADVRFGEGPSLDAGALQGAVNGPRIDADGPSDANGGFPGSVTLCDVVKVQTVPFAGHVYNLQTKRGWYLANGIVTHNCTMTAVIDTDPE